MGYEILSISATLPPGVASSFQLHKSMLAETMQDLVMRATKNELSKNRIEERQKKLASFFG